MIYLNKLVFLVLFAVAAFMAGCKSDDPKTNEVKDANKVIKTTDQKLQDEKRKKELAELDKVLKDNDEEELPDKGPYKLKIGDVIEISILDEPDMTKEVAVIPDGSITYLLVGEVPAAGKTIAELRKALEKVLEEYMMSPRVSIITTKVHLESEEPFFASVMGAVKQSGKFQLQKGETLTDIIAKAGGFLFVTDTLGGRNLANLKASYITRNGKKLPIDFYSLFEEGKMEYNIKIKENDFIYIANAETEQIYVLGEVNAPRLVSYNRNISLIEVIASSGGFTPKAQRTRVIVIRGRGEANHINVDVDALLLGDQKEQNIALRSGDIVFVPEQGMSEYSRYVDYLSTFADFVLKVYDVKDRITNKY